MNDPRLYLFGLATLACTLLPVACGSDQPKTCPPCEQPPADCLGFEPGSDPCGCGWSCDPTARVPNEANEELEEPPAPSADEVATPNASSKPRDPNQIVLGNCVSSVDEREACKAMGSGCFLDAPPILRPPHPCQNRGARCMEDIAPLNVQSKSACMCSCDPEYQKRRQEVETLQHERRYPQRSLSAPCREPKQKSDKAVQPCPSPEPPDLSR